MASRAEKAAALARMAASRRTGVRMSEAVQEFELEKPIFEELDDDAYRKLVSDRRKQKSFVVGDGACVGGGAAAATRGNPRCRGVPALPRSGCASSARAHSARQASWR